MGRKRILGKEEVLNSINRLIIKSGASPTIEELRNDLKVGSTRTVLRYLKLLEEEGEIERWSGARGLRPLKMLKKGIETRPIPLLGEAPAGPFMVAEENREGCIYLPKQFVTPSSAHFFLLRVRGDSMNQAVINGEKIENGDLVLIKQQATASEGQIVVVIVDGEVTIKRFVRGPGYFLLKPESTNRKHRPIIVNNDFKVQGVVTRIFKKGSDLINAAA